MSDKMWEVTIKHAMTCDTGSKMHIYRGPDYTIFLDPVCKLIRADFNGHTFSNRDAMSPLNKVKKSSTNVLNICSLNLYQLHPYVRFLICPLIPFSECYLI